MRNNNNVTTPLSNVAHALNQVILGKEPQIKLALACILARGHLLIEDLPGMGKTTLAHALARVLGLDFRRVQFTSDLLPADILGVSVYDRNASAFTFHPGPIFTNVLLADEINRATPKTQSALLEVMEERQMTMEGETRKLPEPFIVIATQNPETHIGTFPLPESQLDRFLMRISLGYPDAASERNLLTSGGSRTQLETLPVLTSPQHLLKVQQIVTTVTVSGALLDYLQAILDYSRRAPEFEAGLSPRAGLALKQSAQAWALLEGRAYAIPEDLQAVLPSVAGHRLRGAQGGEINAAHLLARVAVP